MKSPAKSSNEELSLQIGDLRFLVVEDHGFQRWVARRALEDLGAKVVLEAGDGRAALEILQNSTKPVDIIVSDLDMPEMDGMELIRHIGEVGRPVSLIIASALDSALIGSVETMTAAYGINLLGSISKPVTGKALEEAISRHFNSAANLQKSNTPSPAISVDEILEGLGRLLAVGTVLVDHLSHHAQILAERVFLSVHDNPLVARQRDRRKNEDDRVHDRKFDAYGSPDANWKRT